MNDRVKFTEYWTFTEIILNHEPSTENYDKASNFYKITNDFLIKVQETYFILYKYICSELLNKNSSKLSHYLLTDFLIGAIKFNEKKSKSVNKLSIFINTDKVSMLNKISAFEDNLSPQKYLIINTIKYFHEALENSLHPIIKNYILQLNISSEIYDFVSDEKFGYKNINFGNAICLAAEAYRKKYEVGGELECRTYISNGLQMCFTGIVSENTSNSTITGLPIDLSYFEAHSNNTWYTNFNALFIDILDDDSLYSEEDTETRNFIFHSVTADYTTITEAIKEMNEILKNNFEKAAELDINPCDFDRFFCPYTYLPDFEGEFEPVYLGTIYFLSDDFELIMINFDDFENGVVITREL